LADVSGAVKRAAAARGHAKTGPEVEEAVAGRCLSPPTSYYVDTDQVQQYWCRSPTVVNGTVVDGEYNEGEHISPTPSIGSICREFLIRQAVKEIRKKSTTNRTNRV